MPFKPVSGIDSLPGPLDARPAAIQMRYFCTYFDSNYLVRFLPLYASLCRHVGAFEIYALCFDDHAHEALGTLALEHVVPIALEDFEREDEELVSKKAERSTIEYYFTSSPSLPLYVLRNYAHVDLIAYLDADLYFYSDVAPLYEELGDGSVLIIPHRYPDRIKERAKYGIYNVGLMIFRRDAEGLRCLDWWRAKCLDWCFDEVQADRYADQKYLDQFPSRFDGVCVSKHKGANLGPWNIESFTVSGRYGDVAVDDDPLIFYHFEGYRQEGSVLFDPGMAGEGYRLGEHIIRSIHLPYVNQILKWTLQLNQSQVGVHGSGGTRHVADGSTTAHSFAWCLRCFLAGNYIWAFAGKARYCDSLIGRTLVRLYDTLRSGTKFPRRQRST
jgi:hypothetical protein